MAYEHLPSPCGSGVAGSHANSTVLKSLCIVSCSRGSFAYSYQLCRKAATSPSPQQYLLSFPSSIIASLLRTVR